MSGEHFITEYFRLNMARLTILLSIAVGIGVAVANPPGQTEAEVGATMEEVLAIAQKAVDETYNRMKRSHGKFVECQYWTGLCGICCNQYQGCVKCNDILCRTCCQY